MTLTNDLSSPLTGGRRPAAVTPYLTSTSPISNSSGSVGTDLSSASHPLSPSLPTPPLGRQSDPIPLAGTSCVIQPKVSLAKLTSFRVGGTAEWFVAPRTVEEVQASLDWASTHDVPMTLIGAGSNLLISDRGIPGLVLCTRRLKQASFNSDTGEILANAGEPLARLAWQAAERGWRGLEWAVGIPGTVGGAVVMNAGAHRACTADVLVDTQTLSDGGTLNLFQTSDLNFSYRTSALQHSNLLVTQARFQLQPGYAPQEVLADTRHHLKHRHATQPYHLPSCGSVFRNPSSHAAGWLIEQTGLKGYRIGGAQVAQRHANFILNLGDATASDIFNLIRHVQQQVERHWSLVLHPEVKVLGEF